MTGVAAGGTNPALRAGTRTFLFSDFEDAMRLRTTVPDAMEHAVGTHREIVSDAAARASGEHFGAEGERSAGVTTFRSPADALQAALDVQCAVRAHECPSELGSRVRIALHTAELRSGLERSDAALALGRCARLAAIARGGQTLMSRATRDLVVGQLPDGVELVDLGVHRLPDLGRPEHVYGLAYGDQPASPGALRSLDTVPNNLPYELTSFVGREHELAEVGGLLRKARLLTLTGSGGCGKTRLALRAAADALERFPDGVWWVELAPVSDPGLVAEAVCDAVGIRPLPGQGALEAAVVHLKTRQALILLDNCEHMIEAAAEVAEALLEGCCASVLATSRAPLDLPAETTWRVPSLSLPENGTDEWLHSLADSDAVRLFVERATKVQPDFTMRKATAPALGAICSELDGIPLAIELAAARVRLLSVEQVAAGLSDRFRLLTGGTRTALPRHRTLRASVEWSHALLSGEERVLLRRLAVFVGGFTLEAAEQVCALDDRERAAVSDMLASLVDKSLVVVVEQRGEAVRYRLLETVRQYEFERLRETQELDVMRDRHRDFFLALAERVGPGQPNAGAQVEPDALDEDSANLDAALRRATETDGERALRLCAALHEWWMQHGLFAARDAAYVRALDKAGPEPTPLRAQVLAARVQLLNFAGQHEAAKAIAQEALEVAEEVGDPPAIGRAVVGIGLTALLWSDPGEVRPLQKRACELLRAGGDDLSLVTITQIMAWGLIRSGKEEGELLLEQVFPIVERMGDPVLLWRHWAGMALRHHHDGNTERFFELAGRAIEVARESGDAGNETLTHTYIAVVELAQGRTEQALARLEAGRERAIAAGAGLSLSMTEYMLGAAEATLGDFDGARARLEAVVAAIPQGGFHFGWAAAQLADVLRIAGDVAGAERWARKGLDVNERVDAPHGIGWCKEILGRLAADRGDWSEAEALLHEALAARAESQMRLWLPPTLDGLAVVAAGLAAHEEAAHEEAARLLGAAARMRSDLAIVRWAPDEPRFEALELDLRLEMGDAAFGAAWNEGSRLTIEEVVAWTRRMRGSRKRPPVGWESLTPTELRVARHAAEGLTNAEIGQAMFISSGTVKTHLSHIYAKLGVRNRAQLSAEAASRRLAGSAER